MEPMVPLAQQGQQVLKVLQALKVQLVLKV